MSELRYTLVSDGSSDRALMRILTWLLREHGVNCPIQEEWADLRRLRLPPRTLPERILRSIELYPCDLLFVHRDAETIPRERRANEIRDALTEAAGIVPLPTAICVVPVRMQEAWLLFNEVALRRAAGNPNGRDVLNLPPIATVELIPDPKQLLHDLLRQSCGRHGHRSRSPYQAHLRCTTAPEIHAIQNPARLGWKPLVRIEHYHLGTAQILDVLRQE